MNPQVGIFLSGIFMATFAVAGIFFFKFWKASQDRFFLLFGIACWLIACERVALLQLRDGVSLTMPESESASLVYLIRLVAFMIILVAIIIKNKQANSK